MSHTAVAPPAFEVARQWNCTILSMQTSIQVIRVFKVSFRMSQHPAGRQQELLPVQTDILIIKRAGCEARQLGGGIAPVAEQRL